MWRVILCPMPLLRVDNRVASSDMIEDGSGYFSNGRIKIGESTMNQLSRITLDPRLWGARRAFAVCE